MKELEGKVNEIKNLLSILVVEDDKGLVHLIQKRLEREGYRVITSFSGEEAITTVLKEREVLLLLDYRLGDMTGKLVMDRLLQMGLNVPFITMTGHGDERTAVEMMKLGAKDYLVKDEAFIDILPQVLDNVLHRLLMEKRLSLAKQALEESEKRFRMIFNSGSDAIFLNDEKKGKPGHFIEVNNITCKRLGYTREELLQMTLEDIEDPGWKKEHPVLTGHLFEKKSLLYEMIHVTKGGKRIPVEINSHLINFGGKPAFLSVSRDITERKLLEDQLRQAQKLEAIGKLAGGVAHDFNNLLTTINGYAEFVLLKMEEDNPFKEWVKKIKRAGEKAAALTQQLLAFGRKQMLQPELVDPNHLIRSIEKMLKRLVGDEIRWVSELEPNIMRIKADPALVEQIILNLCVNASDAMKESGTLVIKTENKVIDEYYSTLLPGSRPGKFVCLSISDSGEGMDGETLKYIFEPFFTTKEVGTGLGLAVVYGIIKQHNGWINVYSEPGKGTVFRVYFPAFAVRDGEEVEEKVLLDELSGNGEKILFVGDEAGVRNMTVKFLRDYGYEVIEAMNVREAVDIFEKQGGEFHLCFSDTVLPDRTGVELAQELLSAKPELRVLLSSGESDRQLQWLEANGKELSLLHKPYSLADLLLAIKEILK